MTTFYCVRHGKTEYNQHHIFQGGTADSPLLPEGKQAATTLGKYFASEAIHFDYVFVSPQGRAQDTAHYIVAELSPQPALTTVRDLREMEFGKWDGTPEADYHHLPEFQKLVHEPHLYEASAHGGETFTELLERTLNVFKKIQTEHPESTVLIVAHGLLLQSIIKYFQGVPLSDIRKGEALKNTSVSIIEGHADLSFDVTSWNDTHFL